jgi:hypothetical protein
LVSAIKQRAGKIGAAKRWGAEPRIVRLDALTPPQRRLVLALVDAARKEASPVSETSGEANGGGTRDADSAS